MSVEPSPVRSRRNVIVAAVAGAAGLLLAPLGQRDAEASTGTMSYGTSMDAGADETSLSSGDSIATLSIANSGGGSALALEATGGGPAIVTGGMASLSSTSPVLVVNANTGTEPLVKVLAEVAPAMLLNYPESQAGLLVYGGITPPVSLPTDVAVYALVADGFVGSGIGPARGVVGNGGSGIGVQGLTAGGVGVDARATATTGTALRTTGKVQFSRSGRTSITARHASRTVRWQA